VDPESIVIATAIGEQILIDEHRFLVDEATDNSKARASNRDDRRVRQAYPGAKGLRRRGG